MPKADPLIRTKLHLPSTRSAFVPRARLQERIMQGLRCPLTLITAPAGFGKTTLVASCAARCGLPVAWLSLDKDDNQAGRFLNYLTAALQGADQRIGSEAAQLIAGMQQASPEAVLTSLINDLVAANAEIVLVLDDYQFITSPAVNTQMTFFIEHCPHTLHLLIATRSDPPLSLARYRAGGQMVELRAADLRFTPQEANQFLNEMMDLHLNAGAVAVLEERTEGWIAGLQMAAIALQSHLSMRDRKDVDALIAGFSGTNRYILDYLIEEVLSQQPPEIQFFLLCTSILERLSAPLCQAVLDVEEAAQQFSNILNCQTTLEYLERANLFLVPLDDDRKWYRYHHLFADLLRSRLYQLYPGLAPRLHTLAAAWHETNRFHDEAIHHALVAGDFSGAARLVEAVAENAWLNGQYADILSWTKAIPTALVHTRPWLCIWNAWAHTQMGVSRDIDQWITATEQAVEKQSTGFPSSAAWNSSPEAQALRLEIAALKVFSVSFLPDYDRAIALAEIVLKNPPLSDRKVAQFTRCNLLHLSGAMYYSTGNLRKAEQACQEGIELAKEMDFTLRLLHCTNKLIMVNNVFGDLHRSLQLIEDTRTLLKQRGFDTYFVALLLDIRKAEILYEWNQLEEFERLVGFIVQRTTKVNVPYLLVDSCNIQALDLFVKQDYSSAQNVLNKAKALAQQSYIWEGLAWRTEKLQVRLWLVSGNLSAAVAWAAQEATGGGNALHFSTETRTIARARILLAQGSYQAAVSLLAGLDVSAEVEGRKGCLIEIRALKAIAFLGLKEWDRAEAEIENALALTEPQGYSRTFLDEGLPISTLLSRVAKNPASPQAKYALRLLNAFEGKAGLKLPAQPGAVNKDDRQLLPNPELLEPLSPRELEILHLLAQGKTNQEIALHLILATGTVKAHAASIYRKLDAANRTQAVARARELDILP